MYLPTKQKQKILFNYSQKSLVKNYYINIILIYYDKVTVFIVL